MSVFTPIRPARSDLSAVVKRIDLGEHRSAVAQHRRRDGESATSTTAADRPSRQHDAHAGRAFVPAAYSCRVRARGAAHSAGQLRCQLPLVGCRTRRFADLEQSSELTNELVPPGQQPRVLDRHGGLVGQDLQQAQVVVVEARLARRDKAQQTVDLALVEQRHDEQRVRAHAVRPSVGALSEHWH